MVNLQDAKQSFTQKTALHKNNPNRDYYMATYPLYAQRIN